MAGILVKAGNNMPLHLQLGEYDVGLYPIAILKDDSGAAYLTLDLTDRGDGLYTALSPMPSKNIIATYKTYSDAAKTIESDDSAALDIFILDSVVEQRRDDKIVGIIETAEAITASIESSAVVGTFETNEIAAAIDGQEPISGELETFEITGTIRCMGA